MPFGFLIDINEDVRLLRRKNILVNRLGDKCATVVNNLSSNVEDTPVMNSICYDLCQQLVYFYDNHWNSWKVKLRRDLSTPWVIVTAASALFLLGLNVVQTVFTIISTVKLELAACLLVLGLLAIDVTNYLVLFPDHQIVRACLYILFYHCL